MSRLSFDPLLGKGPGYETTLFFDHLLSINLGSQFRAQNWRGSLGINGLKLALIPALSRFGEGRLPRFWFRVSNLGDISLVTNSS
jgi:hypothetical protein